MKGHSYFLCIAGGDAAIFPQSRPPDLGTDPVEYSDESSSPQINDCEYSTPPAAKRLKVEGVELQTAPAITGESPVTHLHKHHLLAAAVESRSPLPGGEGKFDVWSMYVSVKG